MENLQIWSKNCQVPMMHPICEAPREGFEPPRRGDSGFRIHRNTGLCDLGYV